MDAHNCVCSDATKGILTRWARERRPLRGSHASQSPKDAERASRPSAPRPTRVLVASSERAEPYRPTLNNNKRSTISADVD